MRSQYGSMVRSPSPGSRPRLPLTDVQYLSFIGISNSIEESQQAFVKNHLPISEHEGDIRRYRAFYAVYLRSTTNSNDSLDELRNPSLFIGRVGVRECGDYGPPLSDDLTIPKNILERERILKYEVGYAFMTKAWGNGYATEAMKVFVEAYLNSSSFWNPPFEQIYLHAVTGGGNPRSRRVLEKIGFKRNGIHRWEGPDVFIGGAMQPPEVWVYSLGPSAGMENELQSSDHL